MNEQYIYDGSNLLAVLDGTTGAVTQRYFNGMGVNGQSGVLAQETVSGGGGSSTKWALSDQNGSIRDVVNGGSGHAILSHTLYNSFGAIVSQTGVGNALRMGYDGYQYDTNTGMYYANARYYDPGQGRFLSEDPTGFAAGDMNLYRFVGNHPTTATDPTGLYEGGSTLSAGSSYGTISTLSAGSNASSAWTTPVTDLTLGGGNVSSATLAASYAIGPVSSANLLDVNTYQDFSGLTQNTGSFAGGSSPGDYVPGLTSTGGYVPLASSYPGDVPIMSLGGGSQANSGTALGSSMEPAAWVGASGFAAQSPQQGLANNASYSVLDTFRATQNVNINGGTEMALVDEELKWKESLSAEATREMTSSPSEASAVLEEELATEAYISTIYGKARDDARDLGAFGTTNQDQINAAMYEQVEWHGSIPSVHFSHEIVGYIGPESVTGPLDQLAKLPIIGNVMDLAARINAASNAGSDSGSPLTLADKRAMAWDTLNLGLAFVPFLGLDTSVGANIAEGSVAEETLTPGAALTAQYGDQFQEYMQYRNQDFSPTQAQYLTEPYTGVGHHFPITQAAARNLGLPTWIRDNPLNILNPNGISRGQFYTLHYQVDPNFFAAQFPKSIGGVWDGSAIGLQKYGTLSRVWYGSPTPLKVVGGSTIVSGAAAGAAGAYYFYQSGDGQR